MCSGELRMLPIPAALQASFEAYLRAGEIPETARASYKKWLRST
jgi:hypothetical protein